MLLQTEFFLSAAISLQVISLIGVRDAVNIKAPFNQQQRNSQQSPVWGALAIKMQMFTLNVDWNHIDFVPNETWNVSSEVQCPNDVNSPKRFAVILRGGFEGGGPLRANSLFYAIFIKLSHFKVTKDLAIQALRIQPPPNAEISALELPPGWVWKVLSA